jgi:hypothetical protein
MDHDSTVMRILALILLIGSMSFESALAQVPEEIQRYRDDSRGSYQQQRKGILDGNRVRTIYFSTTEVAHWPDGMGGEWPKGSGHNYIDGMTVLIGAKVRLSNGRTITPIEAHYREQFDYDPVLGQQYPWDLEPLPGYIRANSTTPAMSSLPSSWPSTWPAALNLPPGYNGQWFSYFGSGVQKYLQESFSVVDDSRDREFIQTPAIGNPPFYPIPSDTNRGGLGLRVEARTMQWNNPLAEDMIFFHYRITNLSDQDYDSTCFGFYVDPGIGGYQRSAPANSALPDTAFDLAYWWAEGGMGYPDDWPTGYLGLGFLKTPENKGLTALAVNVLGDLTHTGVWPKNDDVIWSRLTGGIELNPLVNNTNIATVLGTGTFSMPRWQTDTVSYVLIFGTDRIQIEGKQLLAQAMARNNYRIPDTLTKLNSFNIQLNSPANGSTVSGTTNISWTVSGNVGKTRAFIYYFRQDTAWATIGTVDQLTSTGQYSWNTTSERDGIFYKVLIICAAENGVAIAMSDSTFIINNAGNGKPDVVPVMPKPGDLLTGVTPIGWSAGDADGDPTTIRLYYQVTGIDHSWTTIAVNLPANSSPYLWDTWQANNGVAALRIVAVSGVDSVAAVVGGLTIHNDRPVVPGNALITERNSHGTGHFEVHVVDSSAVTGDSYVVQFLTLPATNALGYNVFDQRTGEKKVDSAGVGGPGSEGPPFDGLRLSITSDSANIVDTATHWSPGPADIKLTVAKDDLNSFKDYASPSDYEIAWYNGIVDTCVFNAPPRFPRMPVNFLITNQTQGKHVWPLVDDKDRNGVLSFGDTIRFVEDYVSTTTYKLTWEVAYDKGTGANPPPPASGDRFAIRTTKPYLSGDTIIFASNVVLSIEKNRLEHPTQVTLLQNYPNPFNPTTRIAFALPHRSRVTLTVYNTLGQQVATLVNGEMEAGYHSVHFDAAGLASGVYFYRMTAGTYVDTKKLLLIR